MKTMKLAEVSSKVSETREKIASDRERHTMNGKDKLVAICDKNLAKLVSFEKVANRGKLLPISHGGEFDGMAVWEGALLIVKMSPDSFEVDCGNAVVSLRGVEYK